MSSLSSSHPNTSPIIPTSDIPIIEHADSSDRISVSSLPFNYSSTNDKENTVDVVPLESSTTSSSSSSSLSTPSSLSTLLSQLPPEVSEECDEDILQRFQYYYELTQNGHNFTETLRKKKDFRNPYFLNEILEQYALDPYGSNYPSHLFDPTGYSPHEKANRLLIQQTEDEQRRKQQQEHRTSINFINAGSILPSTIPSSSTTTAHGRSTMETMVAEAIARSISVANTLNMGTGSALPSFSSSLDNPPSSSQQSSSSSSISSTVTGVPLQSSLSSSTIRTLAPVISTANGTGIEPSSAGLGSMVPHQSQAKKSRWEQ